MRASLIKRDGSLQQVDLPEPLPKFWRTAEPVPVALPSPNGFHASPLTIRARQRLFRIHTVVKDDFGEVVDAVYFEEDGERE